MFERRRVTHVGFVAKGNGAASRIDQEGLFGRSAGNAHVRHGTPTENGVVDRHDGNLARNHLSFSQAVLGLLEGEGRKDGCDDGGTGVLHNGDRCVGGVMVVVVELLSINHRQVRRD